MECKVCKSKMRLDDKDRMSPNNYDDYYVCENEECMTSCVREIMFGYAFKEVWHSESERYDGGCKDWEVYLGSEKQ